MRILITGFAPFGGESVNPSYEAVRLLPDIIGDCHIVKLELPCVFYESLSVLEDAIRAHSPGVVLCIGQAGGRFAVTPERVAINIDDARIPDNSGSQPIDLPIFEDGQNAYFATVPIRAMVDAVRAVKIPSSVSNTAGTYVCNHVMYGLLHMLATVPEFEGIRGGFVHVPYATEQILDKPDKPSLSMQQITDGLQACVLACISENQRSITEMLAGSGDFSPI
ncbi:MAG: pyroglutamyl-peptidase I [Defluviitaleaceae bacterium]|nr:pyroglutamyl-peptidase I [Defluviitaleaceae bacterium]